MTDFSVRDYRIGTIPGKGYGYKSRLSVTVNVELHTKDGGTGDRTTDHKPVTRFERFTLTSYVWNASGTDILAGGYTPDPLKELIADGRTAQGVSMGTVRDLLALGKYHLNDMKPGCVHQDKSANSPPCPKTGYQWGRAWLVEPLPNWLTADYLRNLLGLKG